MRQFRAEFRHGGLRLRCVVHPSQLALSAPSPKSTGWKITPETSEPAMRRAVATTLSPTSFGTGTEMSAKSTAMPFSWHMREISWQIGGKISTCLSIGTISPMEVIRLLTKVPTPLRAQTSPIPFNVSMAFTAVRCETLNRRHNIFTEGNASPHRA